jgi:hypothetical protein
MTPTKPEARDVEQARNILQLFESNAAKGLLGHEVLGRCADSLRALLSSHERLTRELAACEGHGYLREEIDRLRGLIVGGYDKGRYFADDPLAIEARAIRPESKP